MWIWRDELGLEGRVNVEVGDLLISGGASPRSGCNHKLRNGSKPKMVASENNNF